MLIEELHQLMNGFYLTISTIKLLIEELLIIQN
jgi:hypothetical protein